MKLLVLVYALVYWTCSWTLAKDDEDIKTLESPAICDTDKDCAKFGGALCIDVEESGFSMKRCAANSKKRRACRGTSYGMCPEYSPPKYGLLNSQCVLVAKEDGEEIEPSSNKTESSSSICKNGDTDPDCYMKVQVKELNASVLAQFRCVQLSSCEDVSVFPSTCAPDACSSGPVSMCNERGTCSHSSFLDLTKRKCICSAGFTGKRCEIQKKGGACDIECGAGSEFGKCVGKAGKRSCKCEKLWDKGARCNACNSDKSCKNGGTCDQDTFKCRCRDGYTGQDCSELHHNCVEVDCGDKGQCVDGLCYCLKECVGNNCRECSAENKCADCESPASRPLYHSTLLALSLVFAWYY